jgi:hypothetical protein|tara:strand:- start:17006 stop:17245 length:240 start_codon:yes stop_codon:yes gene_type:complete
LCASSGAFRASRDAPELEAGDVEARAARWAGRRDDGDAFVRRVADSDELAPARRRAPIVVVDERWWGWDHLASHHSRAD